MLDKPAITLLHLGPGLANGIANLYNAQRAKTPLVNVVGEHATWHRHADAPLTMDIMSLAGTVSGWHKTSESTATLAADFAEAVAASRYGQISTFIVPSDNQWKEFADSEITAPQFSFDAIDAGTIDKTARLLQAHDKTALIMGGRALRHRGLQAAARIKAATGCDLIADHLPAYMERGAGLPVVSRIPYFPEAALELLSKYKVVVLVGTGEPVNFFGYEGYSSYLLAEDQKKITIAAGKQNAAEAMEHLAGALNIRSDSNIPGNVLAASSRPGIPSGELTPENVSLTVAALQPENAVIVDEGITTSGPYYPLAAGLPPFTYLTGVGGSIGFGIPCALGVALACPERPVITVQSDGGAMYTVQALWTIAREALNVTTLICSNKSYNILKMGLSRAGVASISPKLASLVDLDRPDINWVKLAEGMGVPAVSVNSVDGLANEFRKALSEPGPHLIEMIIPPSTR